MKSSTIKDVARESGVTIATVSHVLTGKKPVRDTTRRAVLEAVERVSYQPNRAAQSMRSQKTRVIGFAAINLQADGMIGNQGAHAFTIGLSHALTRQSYHVALVELEELRTSNEAELPSALREHFFDGLVAHFGVSPRAGELAQRMGIPILWWDSEPFEPHGCLYRDEERVGREITQSLYDIGHRRIGYTVGQWNWNAHRAGRFTHYSYRHRLASHQAALPENGLEFLPLEGYDIGQLARQMREQQLTAAVCYNVEDGEVIMRAACRLHWRVPEDFSIAVCDRETRSVQRDLHYGGVPYDRYAAGTQAAQMLLTMIANPAHKVPSVRLTDEFERGNTIALPCSNSPTK